MKVFILVAALAAFVGFAQANEGFVMVDAGSSGSKIMSYDKHLNVAPKRTVETDCFPPGSTKKDNTMLRGVSAIGAYDNGKCKGDLDLKSKVDDKQQSDSNAGCGDSTPIPGGNNPTLTTQPSTPLEYKKLLIKLIKERHQTRCKLSSKGQGKKKTCKMCEVPGATQGEKPKSCKVPEASSKKSCTPMGDPENKGSLSMQATAGMRLLPQSLNDKVWQKICGGNTALWDPAEHDGYDFATQASGKCGTIPGTQEAFYEYVAAVELRHQVEKDPSKKGHGDIGTFTVGGASAQIAFPISKQKRVTEWKMFMDELKEKVFGDCSDIMLPKYPKDSIPIFNKDGRADCSKDFIDIYEETRIKELLPSEVAERVLKGDGVKAHKKPVIAIAVISFLGLDGNGNDKSKWVAGGMDAVDRYAARNGCESAQYRTQNTHCRPSSKKKANGNHCKKITTEAACTKKEGWGTKQGESLNGAGIYTKTGGCRWVKCNGPPGCEEHDTELKCATGIAVKLAPATLSAGADAQVNLPPVPGLRMTGVCDWDEAGSADAVPKVGKTAAECEKVLIKGLASDTFYTKVANYFHTHNLKIQMLSYNTNNVHPAATFFDETQSDKPYSEQVILDAKNKAGVAKDFMEPEKLRPTTRVKLESVAASLNHVCKAICDNFSEFASGDGLGFSGQHSCFKCMYMAKFIVGFFPKDTNHKTHVDMKPQVDVAAGMLKAAMKTSFKSLRGRKARTLSSSTAMASLYPELYANPNFHVPIQFHSTTYVDGFVASTFK